MKIASRLIFFIVTILLSLSTYAIGKTLNTPQDANKAILQLVTSTAKYEPSRDAQKAIFDLYGGSVWQDKELAGPFGGTDTAYVTPVYEQRYTEDGIEKLLVIADLTPSPLEDYRCHMCIPAFGGAIFIRKGSKWVIESSEKILGEAFASFALIPISPTKYGIAIRTGDVHYGYEDADIQLVIPHNGKLDNVLNVGFEEKNSGGDCEGVELPPQDIYFSFKEGKDKSAYFDIGVNIKYNDGSCEQFFHYDETKQYHFQNGKYVPVR